MSTVFSIIFAFSLLSLVASFMSDMAHKKKMERYEERFYRGLEVLATLTEKDYKELSEQDRKLYEEIGELRNSLEGRRKVPLPPSYLFPTSPQDIDKDSP